MQSDSYVIVAEGRFSAEGVCEKPRVLFPPPRLTAMLSQDPRRVVPMTQFCDVTPELDIPVQKHVADVTHYPGVVGRGRQRPLCTPAVCLPF